MTEQWNLDAAGDFESPVRQSQGLWVAIKDEYVVEWLLDEKDDQGDELA